MSDAKKRAKRAALCVCISLFGCFLLFLVTCVSFRQTMIPGGAGEAISVAIFEKQKMRAVDKVVLRLEVGDKKTVTITDKDLIRKITKETTVATHTALKVPPEGYIDLYDKDVLVRSMRWCVSTQCVVVYKEDRTHWINSSTFFGFPGSKESRNDVGLVFLSDELADMLDALLEGA